jgi:predicted SAM-dependent methyltransferase
MDKLRINVGCGQTPTNGWKNFDNSPSLRLSKYPLLSAFLWKTGLIRKEHTSFIQFCREHTIDYADAANGLPLQSGSVDALYSSHMLEHLDRQEAVIFLKEARRVLRIGGVIRLVVPDIRVLVEKYIETNDADAFIASTGLTMPRARTLLERMGILAAGSTQHQWMYDGRSLSRLLYAQGFTSPQILKAGETLINDPQDLNLFERLECSVYVEAMNP